MISRWRITIRRRYSLIGRKINKINLNKKANSASLSTGGDGLTSAKRILNKTSFSHSRERWTREISWTNLKRSKMAITKKWTLHFLIRIHPIEVFPHLVWNNTNNPLSKPSILQRKSPSNLIKPPLKTEEIFKIWTKIDLWLIKRMPNKLSPTS